MLTLQKFIEIVGQHNQQYEQKMLSFVQTISENMSDMVSLNDPITANL